MAVRQRDALRRDGGATGAFVTAEVPLYYQLGVILRELILSGSYAADEQIPTEADLVQAYGVSRITVRQSLRLLEEEGLIRREVGRGTFVSRNPATGAKPRIGCTVDDLMSPGQTARLKTLSLGTLAVTDRDATVFGVERGAILVRCLRLRTSRGRPYGLFEDLLPHELGKHLTRSYLRNGSILRFIENRLEGRLGAAEHVFHATIAEPSLAGPLQTPIGSPLLLAQRTLRSGDGSVVSVGRRYYCGESCALSVALTRNKARRGS